MEGFITCLSRLHIRASSDFCLLTLRNSSCLCSSTEEGMLAVKNASRFCSPKSRHLVLRAEVENPWSRRSLINELRLSTPSKLASSLMCSGGDQHPFDDFNEEILKIRFEKIRNLSELSDDGGVPRSIKTLKRQYSQKRKKNKGNCDITLNSSVNKAFSSLFFILKTTQSHVFEIRQMLFEDNDVRVVLATVQKEMQSSFLWLFQQIFASTPQLMMSLMVLLANYTAFCISNSVAMAATPPSSLVVSRPANDLENREDGLCQILEDKMVNSGRLDSIKSHVAGSSWFCDKDGNVHIIGNNSKNERLSDIPSVMPFVSSRENSLEEVAMEGMNCDMTEKNSVRIAGTASTMCSNERHMGLNYSHASRSGAFLPVDYRNKAKRLVADSVARGENLVLQSLYEEAVNELERRSGKALHCVNLDQETVQSLVAPVRTKAESDNYECFERTDAFYRHALSLDCKNPLLLSNYAQFLFVVKHDLDRSEQFFLQAMLADPADAETINRYAGFLWLARGKLSDADKTYKAAIAADPSNTCYAASYAHFLWGIEERGQSNIV